MKIKEELKFTGKEQMPAFEVFFFFFNFCLSVAKISADQPRLEYPWNHRMEDFNRRSQSPDNGLLLSDHFGFK